MLLINNLLFPLNIIINLIKNINPYASLELELSCKKLLFVSKKFNNLFLIVIKMISE